MSTLAPFDAVAIEYDDTFSYTAIGKLQRARVRHFLKTFLREKSEKILEVNCGTGEDALWLTQLGHTVIATDISAEMVEVTTQKIQKSGHHLQATGSTCDINAIDTLGLSGINLVFSNFGGLNCIAPAMLLRLNQNLQSIVVPNGLFIAVIMGRNCWWETFYFLMKGHWKKAFRRYQKTAISATLDAHTTVDTWYYNPKEFSQFFPSFQIVAIHPIGFWIPPSYLEPFFKRWPRLLKALAFLESYTHTSLLAASADHYMLVLRKSD